MSPGMIFPTMSTHNSTSFICNICLEPPAPTQTHPGNQARSTHNQPLQHNSALVLRLPPPPFSSLRPLLKALVKRARGPLAGHPLLLDDRSDQDLGEPRFPFTCGDRGPAALIYFTPGDRTEASWLLSEASQSPITDQGFVLGQPKGHYSTFCFSFYLSILVIR